MRLKSLKLTNFRGYRSPVEIAIDEGLTGIVGKNDFGKSTILEALAIFFEDDSVKPEKGDMNCFALLDGLERFEISCEFDEFSDVIVLDENVETSLSAERLLNAAGALEIVKTYRAASGRLEKTSLRCLHPAADGLKDLLGMKIADLRRMGEQSGIADLVSDKRVASQWRRAIRDSAEPLVLEETLLDVDKQLSTEGKAVWGKIETRLPAFALFKSDRESSDGDAEAKNPLQQAVKDAQAELAEEIASLESRIEASVLDVATRTLEKLREMAPDLASELRPRFKEKPKWTFSFTLDGENGIPINKRGSGVRRLILLNFFRAEAEKAASSSDRRVIYAIEEPETSQHPNFQVLLMNALLALAQQSNRQIIVTTHVPALAGLIPIDGVRFVTKGASGEPAVRMPDDETLREVSESLGVVPEPGIAKAKGIVLVEGKSDVIFLRHAAECLKNDGLVAASLTEAGIVPVPVGGCGSIKHWVTFNVANDLGLPWAVFIDSDVGGGPAAAKTLAKRRAEVEGAGRLFLTTRKREIENYICADLLEQATGIPLAYTEICDAKKLIGAALGISPDSVIESWWPRMDGDRMVETSRYMDGENERVELQETIGAILSILSR